MTPPHVALVAITRHGAALAQRLAPRLPEAEVIVAEKFAEQLAGVPNTVKPYTGAFSGQIADLFANYDQIVFFVSLGAVVRLIAPHLKSKDEDPGVLVVDDAAQFVIPVLSGHVGGANAYAEHLATLLGATAVLTTASDVGKTIPVDILGRELGWRVEAPKINITRVSAHVVNGEPVAFVQEAGARNWWTRPTPLPANIQLFERIEDVDPDRYPAVLWVTRREVPAALRDKLAERLVVYRPPEGKARIRVILGVGCDRGTPLETLRSAVARALAAAGIGHESVCGLATIDKKSDEPCIRQLAEQEGWPLAFFTAAQLAAVPVPNPSETVRRYMGTPAVAEAAALLAAKAGIERLLVEKHKHRGADGRNATVSIARMNDE